MDQCKCCRKVHTNITLNCPWVIEDDEDDLFLKAVLDGSETTDVEKDVSLSWFDDLTEKQLSSSLSHVECQPSSRGDASTNVVSGHSLWSPCPRGGRYSVPGTRCNLSETLLTDPLSKRFQGDTPSLIRLGLSPHVASSPSLEQLAADQSDVKWTSAMATPLCINSASFNDSYKENDTILQDEDVTNVKVKVTHRKLFSPGVTIVPNKRDDSLLHLSDLDMTKETDITILQEEEGEGDRKIDEVFDVHDNDLTLKSDAETVICVEKGPEVDEDSGEKRHHIETVLNSLFSSPVESNEITSMEAVTVDTEEKSKLEDDGVGGKIFCPSNDFVADLGSKSKSLISTESVKKEVKFESNCGKGMVQLSQDQELDHVSDSLCLSALLDREKSMEDDNEIICAEYERIQTLNGNKPDGKMYHENEGICRSSSKIEDSVMKKGDNCDNNEKHYGNNGESLTSVSTPIIHRKRVFHVESKSEKKLKTFHCSGSSALQCNPVSILKSPYTPKSNKYRKVRFSLPCSFAASSTTSENQELNHREATTALNTMVSSLNCITSKVCTADDCAKTVNDSLNRTPLPDGHIESNQSSVDFATDTRQWEGVSLIVPSSPTFSKMNQKDAVNRFSSCLRDDKDSDGKTFTESGKEHDLTGSIHSRERCSSCHSQNELGEADVYKIQFFNVPSDTTCSPVGASLSPDCVNTEESKNSDYVSDKTTARSEVSVSEVSVSDKRINNIIVDRICDNRKHVKSHISFKAEKIPELMMDPSDSLLMAAYDDASSLTDMMGVNSILPSVETKTTNVKVSHSDSNIFGEKSLEPSSNSTSLVTSLSSSTTLKTSSCSAAVILTPVIKCSSNTSAHMIQSTVSSKSNTLDSSKLASLGTVPFTKSTLTSISSISSSNSSILLLSSLRTKCHSTEVTVSPALNHPVLSAITTSISLSAKPRKFFYPKVKRLASSETESVNNVKTIHYSTQDQASTCVSSDYPVTNSTTSSALPLTIPTPSSASTGKITSLAQSTFQSKTQTIADDKDVTTEGSGKIDDNESSTFWSNEAQHLFDDDNDVDDKTNTTLAVTESLLHAVTHSADSVNSVSERERKMINGSEPSIKYNNRRKTLPRLLGFARFTDIFGNNINDDNVVITKSDKGVELCPETESERELLKEMDKSSLLIGNGCIGDDAKTSDKVIGNERLINTAHSGNVSAGTKSGFVSEVEKISHQVDTIAHEGERLDCGNGVDGFDNKKQNPLDESLKTVRMDDVEVDKKDYSSCGTERLDEDVMEMDNHLEDIPSQMWDLTEFSQMVGVTNSINKNSTGQGDGILEFDSGYEHSKKPLRGMNSSAYTDPVLDQNKNENHIEKGNFCDGNEMNNKSSNSDFKLQENFKTSHKSFKRSCDKLKQSHSGKKLKLEMLSKVPSLSHKSKLESFDEMFFSHEMDVTSRNSELSQRTDKDIEDEFENVLIGLKGKFSPSNKEKIGSEKYRGFQKCSDENLMNPLPETSELHQISRKDIESEFENVLAGIQGNSSLSKNDKNACKELIGFQKSNSSCLVKVGKDLSRLNRGKTSGEDWTGSTVIKTPSLLVENEKSIEDQFESVLAGLKGKSSSPTDKCKMKMKGFMRAQGSKKSQEETLGKDSNIDKCGKILAGIKTKNQIDSLHGKENMNYDPSLKNLNISNISKDSCIVGSTNTNDQIVLDAGDDTATNDALGGNIDEKFDDRKRMDTVGSEIQEDGVISVQGFQTAAGKMIFSNECEKKASSLWNSFNFENCSEESRAELETSKGMILQGETAVSRGVALGGFYTAGGREIKLSDSAIEKANGLWDTTCLGENTHNSKREPFLSDGKEKGGSFFKSFATVGGKEIVLSESAKKKAESLWQSVGSDNLSIGSDGVKLEPIVKGKRKNCFGELSENSASSLSDRTSSGSFQSAVNVNHMKCKTGIPKEKQQFDKRHKGFRPFVAPKIVSKKGLDTETKSVSSCDVVRKNFELNEFESLNHYGLKESVIETENMGDEENVCMAEAAVSRVMTDLNSTVSVTESVSAKGKVDLSYRQGFLRNESFKSDEKGETGHYNNRTAGNPKYEELGEFSKSVRKFLIKEVVSEKEEKFKEDETKDQIIDQEEERDEFHFDYEFDSQLIAEIDLKTSTMVDNGLSVKDINEDMNTNITNSCVNSNTKIASGIAFGDNIRDKDFSVDEPVKLLDEQRFYDSNGSLSGAGMNIIEEKIFYTDGENVHSVSKPFIGFSTAAGHSVSVSDNALERARKFLNEDDFTSSTRQSLNRDNHGIGNSEINLKSLASGVSPAASENAKSFLNSSDEEMMALIDNEDADNQKDLSRVTMIGEKSDYGGIQDRISKKSFEKAKSNLSSPDDAMLTKNRYRTVSDPLEEKKAPVKMIEFFTASKFEDSLSGECLKIAECCLNKAEAGLTDTSNESRSIHQTENCGSEQKQFIGFLTAAGSKVSVSEKAMVNAKRFLNDDVEGTSEPDIQINQRECSKNSLCFPTAAGDTISLSENALSVARRFLNDDDNVLALEGDKIDQERTGFNRGECNDDKDVPDLSNATGAGISDFKKIIEKAKTYLHDDNLHIESDFESNSKNTDLKYTKRFMGFSTATGYEVSVSEDALVKAKSFLNDDNDDDNNGDGLSSVPSSKNDTKMFAGFSTAAGTKVSVTEKALAKAKSFLNDDDGEMLKVKGPKFGGFSTAAGSEVSVSENALEKAKSFLNDDNNSDGKSETPTDTRAHNVEYVSSVHSTRRNDTKMFTGFSNATGTKVSVTEKSLAKIKSFLNDDDSEMLKVKGPKFGGFSTAAGSEVSVSENALEKAKSFLNDDNSSDGKYEAPTHTRTHNVEYVSSVHSTCRNDTNMFTGFSTATGTKVSVTEKSLAKAKSFLNDDDNDVEMLEGPKCAAKSFFTDCQERNVMKTGDNDNRLKEDNVFKGNKHHIFVKSPGAGVNDIFIPKKALEQAEILLRGKENKSQSCRRLSEKVGEDDFTRDPISPERNPQQTVCLTMSMSPGAKRDDSNQLSLKKRPLVSKIEEVLSDRPGIKRKRLRSVFSNTLTGEQTLSPMNFDRLQSTTNAITSHGRTPTSCHVKTNAKSTTQPSASSSFIPPASTSTSLLSKQQHNSDGDINVGSTTNNTVSEGYSATHSGKCPIFMSKSRSRLDRSNVCYSTRLNKSNPKFTETTHLYSEPYKSLSEDGIIGKMNCAKSVNLPSLKVSEVKGDVPGKRDDEVGNMRLVSSVNSCVGNAVVASNELDDEEENKFLCANISTQIGCVSVIGDVDYHKSLVAHDDGSVGGGGGWDSSVCGGSHKSAISITDSNACGNKSDKSLSAHNSCEHIRIIESSNKNGLCHESCVNDCKQSDSDIVGNYSHNCVGSIACVHRGGDSSGKTGNAGIDVTGLTEARMNQEKIIRDKKKRKITPRPGRLMEQREATTTKKMGNGERYDLQSLRDESFTRNWRPTREKLLQQDVSETTLSVNSGNAADYKFDLRRFYPAGVPSSILVGDGAFLVHDGKGFAGCHQFYRAFLTLDGVDPNLVDEPWVRNHYRWIVWKLAAYEVCFPNACAGRSLTPHMVMLQLKYRCDREIDRAHRSAIKKIIEKDDTSAKRMVLCVAGMKKDANGQTLLEMTDGWYSIWSKVDTPLSNLVSRSRLSVGVKFVTTGAELEGAGQGCSPLEMGEDVRLSLRANSTRPVPWISRLGFQSNPMSLCVPLSSLHPDGGIVGCVDVVVSRIYPVMYMEKQGEGKYVFRTREEEDEERRRQSERREREVEKIYLSIQSKMEEEEIKHNTKMKRRTWTRRDVKELSTGEELLNVWETSFNQEDLQMLLSEDQLRKLVDHRQACMADKQMRLNQRVKESIAESNAHQERFVMPVQKLRVVGCSNRDIDLNCESMLTVWRPSADWSDIREGQRYRMYQLAVSSSRWNSGPQQHDNSCKVALASTRHTRMQKLHIGDNLLDLIYQPREVLTVKEVGSLAGGGSSLEFDFVGVALKIDSPNGRGDSSSSAASGQGRPLVITSVDKHGDVLVIKIWKGAQSIVSSLKDNQCFVALNLSKCYSRGVMRRPGGIDTGGTMTTMTVAAEARQETSSFSTSVGCKHGQALTELQEIVTPSFLEKARLALDNESTSSLENRATVTGNVLQHSVPDVFGGHERFSSLDYDDDFPQETVEKIFNHLTPNGSLRHTPSQSKCDTTDIDQDISDSNYKDLCRNLYNKSNNNNNNSSSSSSRSSNMSENNLGVVEAKKNKDLVDLADHTQRDRKCDGSRNRNAEVCNDQEVGMMGRERIEGDGGNSNDVDRVSCEGNIEVRDDYVGKGDDDDGSKEDQKGDDDSKNDEKKLEQKLTTVFSSFCKSDNYRNLCGGNENSSSHCSHYKEEGKDENLRTREVTLKIHKGRLETLTATSKTKVTTAIREFRDRKEEEETEEEEGEAVDFVLRKRKKNLRDKMNKLLSYGRPQALTPLSGTVVSPACVRQFKSPHASSSQ